MQEASSTTQHTVSTLVSQYEAFSIADMPHKARDVCEINVNKITKVKIVICFMIYFLILTMVKKDFTSFA